MNKPADVSIEELERWLAEHEASIIPREGEGLEQLLELMEQLLKRLGIDVPKQAE